MKLQSSQETWPASLSRAITISPTSLLDTHRNRNMIDFN